MTNPNCEPIEPLLAACADGAASEAERARVTAHVATCAACAQALQLQQLIHQAMALHGRAAADSAPPGLRTRIAATLAADRTPVLDIGWRTRLSAFAAAALVVLALGAIALPVITGRSNVVLAAQLALDHLKCFTIDGHDHGQVLSVADAEAELLHDYGWQLRVPQTGGADHGRLISVRRCIYGDGRAAHLLYRVDGEPVSLFILPGLERPADQLSLFGSRRGGLERGRPDPHAGGPCRQPERLREMASNLRNGAE